MLFLSTENKQGDERKPAKMIDNQRAGDDLRGQGDNDQLAEQGHCQAYLFNAEPPFKQVEDVSFQRRHQHDKAQGRHKTQSKAHVPQSQRV